MVPFKRRVEVYILVNNRGVMPRSACMPGSACHSQLEGDAVFGSGLELAKIDIPGCLRQIHCYMYGVHVHMIKHCYEVREIVIKSVYSYEH